MMLVTPMEIAFAMEPVSVDISADEPVVLRQGLPRRRISGSSRCAGDFRSLGFGWQTL